MSSDKFGMLQSESEADSEPSNISNKLSNLLASTGIQKPEIPPALLEKAGKQAGFVNRDEKAGYIRPRRYRPVSDEPSVRFNLTIKQSLSEKYKDLADELSLSYPALLETLLNHWRNTH